MKQCPKCCSKKTKEVTNGGTSDKTIRRWLQSVGKDLWEDLITLRIIDRKGNLAKQNRPAVTRHIRLLRMRVQKMLDSGVPIFKEDLAINGHDLIALGLKPGPEFQRIFEACLSVVINEPHKNNKEDLEKFVRKNYG